MKLAILLVAFLTFSNSLSGLHAQVLVAEDEELKAIKRINGKARRQAEKVGARSLNRITGYYRYDYRKGAINKEIPVYVLAIGPYLAGFRIETSGELKMMGAAEQQGGQWMGHWVYDCEDCCPKYNYLDAATISRHQNRKALKVKARAMEIDEESCQRTSEPTSPVVYDLKRLSMLSFEPYAPGKYVRVIVIAAPAEYRAAFKVG